MEHGLRFLQTRPRHEELDSECRRAGESGSEDPGIGTLSQNRDTGTFQEGGGKIGLISGSELSHELPRWFLCHNSLPRGGYPVSA